MIYNLAKFSSDRISFFRDTYLSKYVSNVSCGLASKSKRLEIFWKAVTCLQYLTIQDSEFKD